MPLFQVDECVRVDVLPNGHLGFTTVGENVSIEELNGVLLEKVLHLLC